MEYIATLIYIVWLGCLTLCVHLWQDKSYHDKVGWGGSLVYGFVLSIVTPLLWILAGSVVCSLYVGFEKVLFLIN